MLVPMKMTPGVPHTIDQVPGISGKIPALYATTGAAEVRHITALLDPRHLKYLPS